MAGRTLGQEAGELDSPGTTEAQQQDFGRSFYLFGPLFFHLQIMGWSQMISLVPFNSKMHFVDISEWFSFLTNFHKTTKSSRRNFSGSRHFIVSVQGSLLALDAFSIFLPLLSQLLPICSPPIPCFWGRPMCSGTPACFHTHNLYNSAPWPWRHLVGSVSLFHAGQ